MKETNKVGPSTARKVCASSSSSTSVAPSPTREITGRGTGIVMRENDLGCSAPSANFEGIVNSPRPPRSRKVRPESKLEQRFHGIVREIVPAECAEQVCDHLDAVIAGMIGHGGLHDGDREDIWQQMIIQLAIAFQKYDPARGKAYTLANKVIKNTRATIFTKRIRKGADKYFLPFDDTRRSDTADSDDPDDEQSGDPLDCDFEKRLLQMDVRAVLDTLPERPREFGYAVLEHGTIRKAKVALRISSNSYIDRYLLPPLRRALGAEFTEFSGRDRGVFDFAAEDTFRTAMTRPKNIEA